MYRGCALLNEVTYEAYQRHLLRTEHWLRTQIFKSFIITSSLRPDNYDLLGSVTGSVLNDHSSQCGTSIYTESICESNRDDEEIVPYSRPPYNSSLQRLTVSAKSIEVFTNQLADI